MSKPRVSLLVNIVAPYRLPVYQALGRAFNLRVSTAGQESNRNWADVEAELRKGGVQVRQAWGLTLKRQVHDQGQGGVMDMRYLHLTPGYFWNLVQERPDAIISNELGMRSMLALLYGKLFQKPVWIWWGGTLHTERQRSGLKCVIRRLLVTQVKHWISYGRSSTDYLLSIGVSRQMIVQIQNAVDETRFRQDVAPTLMPEVRPHLLYVGQMIGRKGVLALLESAARIQQEGYSFSLTLVGGGPETEELKNVSAHLGLRHVAFMPPQKPAEMPGIYRSADALIFPTLEDVWGLVVNEALWSGVPVMSSIYGGCTEEIIPMENWFDPAKEASIDAALRRAVTGQAAPVDQEVLKSTNEVAETIINDIRSTLKR